MAWLAVAATRGRRILSHAATPSQRGGYLSGTARTSFTGTDRAHADRLRSWRLSARLVEPTGPPPSVSPSSRPGYYRRLRRLHASRGISAGKQSLWPQHLGLRATSPILARRQRRSVCMG